MHLPDPSVLNFKGKEPHNRGVSSYSSDTVESPKSCPFPLFFEFYGNSNFRAGPGFTNDKLEYLRVPGSEATKRGPILVAAQMERRGRIT
jgi:hypothetical protein